jgi:hypothetical protein
MTQRDEVLEKIAAIIEATCIRVFNCRFYNARMIEARKVADAVLTAALAEHMVVPREPTEAMLEAGDSMMPQIAPGQDITTGYDALKEVWPAMYDAFSRQHQTPVEKIEDGQS